jgi:hypothetical protein
MQAPPDRIARNDARRWAVFGGRSIPEFLGRVMRTVQPGAATV